MPLKCSTLFRIISRILVLYCLMKEIHLFFFSLGILTLLSHVRNFHSSGAREGRYTKT